MMLLGYPVQDLHIRWFILRNGTTAFGGFVTTEYIEWVKQQAGDRGQEDDDWDGCGWECGKNSS